METYRELYNSIENPIVNPQIFDILMEQYSNNQGLYNIITSVYRKEKKKKNINQKHKEGIALVLFDYWSQSIQEQSESILPTLKKEQLYQNMTIQEFRELQRTLRSIGKVTSIQRLIQIQKDYPLIRKYLPNKSISNNDIDSWTHILSEQYDRFDGKKEVVEHRLYLNVENENLYEILYCFIKKITDMHLPYHFKYSEGLRDDSIVIYSDKEHLKDYIQILRDIKKERSYLFSDYLKPPILTGKIDGWIGYGSEPGTNKSSSFNSKRINVMEDSIDDVFYSYISNSDLPITMNNKKMTLNEYYAHLITKRIVDDYNNQLARVKTQKDIDGLYNRTGFLPNDLNDEAVKKLYEEVKLQIPDVIDKLKNKKESDQVLLKITTKKGKMNTSLMNREIKAIIRSFAGHLYRSNKTFLQQIIKIIMVKSRDKGIDIEKYCFDVDKRDGLFRVDSIQSSEQLQSMFTSSNTTQNNQRKASTY